jgi:large subunit ribosomal protein L17
MRHRKHNHLLGVKTAHRTSLLANLSCSLIENGRIKTTLAKARALRPTIEKAITLAKKAHVASDPAPKVHYRRLAIARLRNKKAVKKLFDELVEQFVNRNGGYTRIYKLAMPRLGDAAEMAIIEFVEDAPKEKSKKKKASPKKATKQKKETTTKAKEDSEGEDTKEATEPEEVVEENAEEATTEQLDVAEEDAGDDEQESEAETEKEESSSADDSAESENEDAKEESEPEAVAEESDEAATEESDDAGEDTGKDEPETEKEESSKD